MDLAVTNDGIKFRKSTASRTIRQWKYTKPTREYSS